MALQTRGAKTRSIEFGVNFDVYRTLITIGIVLLVLKTIGSLGVGRIGWGDAATPFIIAWTWKTVFRIQQARYKARHPVKPVRRVTHDIEAIGWSVAMGLLPSYGHDNDPVEVSLARDNLARQWEAAMAATEKWTGIMVSAVMSDATVHYPVELGCPKGGESVVVISGSSNPTKIPADRFDDYIDAVEMAVQTVREAMGQNSVRIEFTRIARSTYFRADGRY